MFGSDGCPQSQSALSPAAGRSGKGGTLAKEGIMPTVFTGAGRNKTTLRDQEKHEIHAPIERRKLSLSPIPFRGLAPKTSTSSSSSSSSYSSSYLPRSNWISLGDGWFQATPTGSGSSSRCGVHSVIEAEPGNVLLCVYEPRTVQAASAIFASTNPEYDVEVHVKIFSDQSSIRSLKGQVVFALKSPSDYLSLIVDAKAMKWSLQQFKDGTTTTICDAFDPSMRTGVFHPILIQIRAGAVSIDINGSPMFTAIKISEGVSLAGLAGLQSKGAKFAVKNWKIRGSGGNSGTSTSSSTGVGTSTAAAAAAASLQGQTKGPKSLSQLFAASDSSAVADRYVSTRLGEPPVPIGGGGPGRSREAAVNTQTHKQQGNETDIDLPLEECSLTSKVASCFNLLAGKHERGIIETVMRDVIQRDLGVTFNDIAALANAKRLLNEAIVLPLLMPEFFTGIREPWRGVLLFGPPGTGKTLLAKAVAGINSSTFFSCSASSLVSKFRGESEKIVRCLFEAARLCAPSIVFLDEVDALVSSRGDGEHEASRRLKTEFFAQMDGVNTSSGDKLSDNIMVLCTTNCPWDLDEALRRRLEKRIYIPLPDLVARIDLFTICLRNIPVGEVNVATLAVLTEGYSGADVHLVCREASMIPMRKLLETNTPNEIKNLRMSGQIGIPDVEFEDFELAIKNTKSSVGASSIGRFEAWDQEFGSR